MNIFGSEFWTLCISSAFQGEDSGVRTMEQAVSSQPVPLESESNTDNMENSSPGKTSSFYIEQKICLFVCCVCVYIHTFLNNRRVCNNWIMLAQCSVMYLIAIAVVLHSQESILSVFRVIKWGGDIYIIRKKIILCWKKLLRKNIFLHHQFNNYSLAFSISFGW